MSLYSALRSGVSALQSQTQAMAMVSNNISNLNTNGFKRTAASFSTLVSGANTATNFAGGSVISRPNLKATSVGQITKTMSNTDMAINGQGFFAVSKSSSTAFNVTTGKWENTDEVLYTRLGDFSKNKNGLLENSAGYILLAWPRNSANTGYDQTNLEGQLKPVTISNTTGTPKATTTININANLSSNSQEAETFSATVDVFDRQGTSHVMKVNFTRLTTKPRAYTVTANMIDTDSALITKYAQTPNPDVMSAISSVSNGVQYVKINLETPVDETATIPPSTFTVTYDEKSGGMTTAKIIKVDRITLNGSSVRLQLSELIPTSVAGSSTTYENIKVNYTGGVPAVAGTPTTTLRAQNHNTDGALASPVTYYDFATVAIGNQLDFSVEVADSYNLGEIQFSEDGTIKADGSSLTASPAGILGGLGVVVVSGVNNVGTTSNNGFNLSFDFAGNGKTANLTGVSDDVTTQLNFAAQSGNTGMTSYDSPHAIYSINQNGSTAGAFKSVSVNFVGEIEAAFSVGDNRKLAQVRSVVFSSANRLEQVDGNAFRKTNSSGTQIIRTAGSAGAGWVTSSTLESSNVDLATEFTDMIVTQRAYSAATKIITTADEMLEELVRAKR